RGGATAAVGQKAALRQRETPAARELGRGAMYFGAAAALAITDAAAALQSGNQVFRMGQAGQAVADSHGQQISRTYNGAHAGGVAAPWRNGNNARTKLRKIVHDITAYPFTEGG